MYKFFLILFFSLSTIAAPKQIIYFGPRDGRELQAWVKALGLKSENCEESDYCSDIFNLKQLEISNPTTLVERFSQTKIQNVSFVIFGDKINPLDFYGVDTLTQSTNRLIGANLLLKTSLVYFSARSPIKRTSDSESDSKLALEKYYDEEETKLDENRLTLLINHIGGTGDIEQWRRIFPNSLIIGYSDGSAEASSSAPSGLTLTPDDYIAQLGTRYQPSGLAENLSLWFNKIQLAYVPANTREFQSLARQWQQTAPADILYSHLPTQNTRYPSSEFFAGDVVSSSADVLKELLLPVKLKFLGVLNSDIRANLVLFYMDKIDSKTTSEQIFVYSAAYDDLSNRNGKWWDDLNDETLAKIYIQLFEELLDYSDIFPSDYLATRFRRALRDPNPEIRGITTELLTAQSRRGNDVLRKDEVVRLLTTALADLNPRVREAASTSIIDAKLDSGPMEKEFSSYLKREQDPGVLASIKTSLKRREKN